MAGLIAVAYTPPKALPELMDGLPGLGGGLFEESPSMHGGRVRGRDLGGLLAARIVDEAVAPKRLKRVFRGQ